MKIEKHGNLYAEGNESQYAEKYRVRCSKCGCVFIADICDAHSFVKGIADDNTKIKDMPTMTFNCPECGNENKVKRMYAPNLYEYHAA